MKHYNQPAQIYFGPYIRKSPYFDATRRYGCQAYDVYNHTYLPSYYNDPLVEYQRLLNDVTLWDVSVERQVEITGPDAAAFTDWLVTRDMTQCAVGQCRYVLLTDDQGGIINDPVLLRLGQNHFWLSLSDSDVLLWAKGAALNSGMDVNLCEPDVSPLQVQGPKSKLVMQALFGDKILEMPYYSLMEADLEGIPVVITRTGWSGEVGYEVYLRDSRRGEELWERILAAGRPHNMAPTPPGEIRRIEAGILNYGSDMTLHENPYEVGLGWVVDLDKSAAFIGQEALRRIKAEGVQRKLVGIEIGGEPLAGWIEHYWPALKDGQRIGRVSAVVYSPRLQKNIGYALVSIEHSRAGCTFTAAAPWGDLEATVVKKPFVDPKKDIPKS
jgi:aminomethyltransferase